MPKKAHVEDEWALTHFCATNWEGLQFDDWMPVGTRYLLFGKNNSGKSSFVRLLRLVGLLTLPIPWRVFEDSAPTAASDSEKASKGAVKLLRDPLGILDRNPELARLLNPKSRSRRSTPNLGIFGETINNEGIHAFCTGDFAISLEFQNIVPDLSARFHLYYQRTNERLDAFEQISQTLEISRCARTEEYFAAKQDSDPEADWAETSLGDAFASSPLSSILTSLHSLGSYLIILGDRLPVGSRAHQMGDYSNQFEKLREATCSKLKEKKFRLIARKGGFPTPKELYDLRKSLIDSHGKNRKAKAVRRVMLGRSVARVPPTHKYVPFDPTSKLSRQFLPPGAHPRVGAAPKRSSLMLFRSLPDLGIGAVARRTASKTTAVAYVEGHSVASLVDDLYQHLFRMTSLTAISEARLCLIYNDLWLALDEVADESDSVDSTRKRSQDKEVRFIPLAALGKGTLWILCTLFLLKNGRSNWFFEHIENYLHPRLAADLFQDIIKASRFSVFETHEESLLLRAQWMVSRGQLQGSNLITLRLHHGRVEYYPVSDDGELGMPIPDGYADLILDMTHERIRT